MGNDYFEIVRRLESLGVMPDRPPTLEPVQQGLRLLLQKLIPSERVIVVAGTNGKGSVCATLEALFLAAGETVGLFISPHLVETTERIRIQGVDVSREVFSLAYHSVVEKTSSLRLSHFETLTLMAAWIFFSGEVMPCPRWVIFEVGLGGTWDATNAIPHAYAVITSLSYDHQNLLGSSLVEIAQNKFGIVHADTRIVVHSPFPEEVQALARSLAKPLGCSTTQWLESVSTFCEVEAPSSSEEGEPCFVLHTPWGHTPMALPGKRSAENSATALTLFQALGYTPAHYLDALTQVRWPGRMERLTPAAPCPLYLSGDHNPDGIRSLLEILPYYPRRHLFILVGVGKDKDLDGILGPLAALPESSLYLTETPFRGRPVAEYGHWLTRARAADADPRQALDQIFRTAQPMDLILVTGSLYLVGEIKKGLVF